MLETFYDINGQAPGTPADPAVPASADLQISAADAGQAGSKDSSAPGGKTLLIAHLSDLHSHPQNAILQSLQVQRPDLIAVTGDLIYGARPANNIPVMKNNRAVLSFLEECRKVAPVFLSLGNHEWMLGPADKELIAGTGTVLLDNDWARLQNLVFGGLSSGITSHYDEYRESLYKSGAADRSVLYPLNDPKELRSGLPPRTGWLEEFMNQPGYRILLCHHPEYRDRYLRKLSAQSDDRGVPSAGRNDQAENLDIDLILSGHAHGGQIRLFNRGLFAPGQGLLPRYTSGIHGNMIISRGLTNTVPYIPRLFNPPEIVYVRIRFQ